MSILPETLETASPGDTPRARPDLAKVLSPFSREMERLDAVIDRLIRSDSCRYFPEAHELCRGGKRLRGALTIAAARAFTADAERISAAIEVAACVEGIHFSSLLHDDVIDEASERRGITTLHRRYGRTGAILAGDLLYVKIFNRLLEMGDDVLVRLITRGTEEMVEGETIQNLTAHSRHEPTIEEYLGCISKKTAAFFRAAASAGARIGGADDAAADAVGAFGHDFGMAFQITDDILDWTADQDALGKDLLCDIRSGKLTLPLLHFLQDDAAAARTFISRALDGEVHPLAAEVARRGLIPRAQHIAKRYAESALAAIESIDAEKEFFRGLMAFTLHRSF